MSNLRCQNSLIVVLMGASVHVIDTFYHTCGNSICCIQRKGFRCKPMGQADSWEVRGHHVLLDSLFWPLVSAVVSPSWCLHVLVEEGGAAGQQAVIRQPGLLGPALTAPSQLDAKSRPARNNSHTHTKRPRFKCLSCSKWRDDSSNRMNLSS